jgi:ElaB protein
MESASNLESEIKKLEIESKKILQRARENYLEQVPDISEKIKKMSDDAKVKTREVIDKVGDYITANPQKSALIGLGIGVGLGILIGSLTKRRKD